MKSVGRPNTGGREASVCRQKEKRERESAEKKAVHALQTLSRLDNSQTTRKCLIPVDSVADLQVACPFPRCPFISSVAELLCHTALSHVPIPSSSKSVHHYTQRNTRRTVLNVLLSGLADDGMSIPFGSTIFDQTGGIPNNEIELTFRKERGCVVVCNDLHRPAHFRFPAQNAALMGSVYELYFGKPGKFQYVVSSGPYGVLEEEPEIVDISTTLCSVLALWKGKCDMLCHYKRKPDLCYPIPYTKEVYVDRADRPIFREAWFGWFAK